MPIVKTKGRNRDSVINRYKKEGCVVTTLHKLEGDRFPEYGMHNYRVHYHKKRRKK